MAPQSAAQPPTQSSTQPAAHIEPSEHSTDEVDGFLEMVEENVEQMPGAGSPAIKPNKALGEDGKPDDANQPHSSV